MPLARGDRSETPLSVLFGATGSVVAGACEGSVEPPRSCQTCSQQLHRAKCHQQRTRLPTSQHPRQIDPCGR